MLKLNKNKGNFFKIICLLIINILVIFKIYNVNNKKNIEEYELELYYGSMFSLSEKIDDKNYVASDLNWTSSNSNIITVSQDGQIEVINFSNEIIKITAKSKDKKYEINFFIKVIMEDEIGLVNLELDKTSVTLKYGETIKLNAKITPNNAAGQKLKWMSSDSSFVKVNDEGLIEIIENKEGKEIVSVISEDGSIIAKCEVNVLKVEELVEPTGILLNIPYLSLKVGDVSTLTASIFPNNVTNKKILWSSSDSNIASVSDTGVVKALKSGVVIISAKTNNGKIATTMITVTSIPEEITIFPDKGTINVGENISLISKILPSNSQNTNIIWSSSNTNVATVSNTGVVKGIKPGTVTITAKTNNGKIANSVVTVIGNNIESIQIAPSIGSVNVGETIALKCTIYSTSGMNESITWTSSDSSIATVSNIGVVKGIKSGNVIISAKSKNGTISTAFITVINKLAESVSLVPSDSNIFVGETITLKGIIYPNEVIDQNLTWTSSNTSVATVSNTGIVKGIKSGIAIITAKTNNGIMATSKITVNDVLVDSISISPNSVNINVNESITLKSTVYPLNAINQNVTWTSSDSSIATVSNTGVVKGIKSGTVIITAKTSNEKVAAAVINVNNSYDSNKNIADIIFLKTQTADNHNGESIIVKTPTNKVILVDTAHKDSNITNNVIIEGLYKYTGDYVIDYLVISHDHPDHKGGLKTLLKDNRVKVKNIIIKRDSLKILNNADEDNLTIYEYIVKNVNKFNYNVITTNNLYEGYNIKIDDYVSINLFNVKDVFNGIANKCNVNINALFFNSNATEKNVAKTVNNKYVYMKINDINKFYFTDKFVANNGYYWGVLDSRENCNYNANSIALLVDIKTSEGNKYVYIPSDLQNDGYPKYGEFDSKYNQTIYGMGSTYDYKVDNNGRLMVNNNGNLIPGNSIIKIPSENLVANEIKQKLGSNINNIIIYQESHHSNNNALDALNILKLNRKDLITVSMHYEDPNYSSVFRRAYSHLNFFTTSYQYYSGLKDLKFTVKNDGSIIKP